MARRVMLGIAIGVIGLVAATVAAGPGLEQARPCPAADEERSVARIWNDQALSAIRRDFPAPTVHARNLYHLSTVMWDTWAAYEPTAEAALIDRSRNGTAAEREVAIGYAAYRLLQHRYENAVGGRESLASFDEVMAEACLSTDLDSLQPGSAADFGLEMAEATITATADDGSREGRGYVDLTYEPANPPLVVAERGTDLVDPARWQPLSLGEMVTQNGQLLPGTTQTYIGPHWGSVTPFAIDPSPLGLPLDPGPPPASGTDEYVAAAAEVVRYQAALNPEGGRRIRIDPGARGANSLGVNDGTGYAVNPHTGQPYRANEVSEADYGRVVAEFWADGPESETPPGHWNVIANQASDALEAAGPLRIAGEGPPVDRLEWDVKLYLALNGATHDAAIAAWGAKAHYDYVRPISMIRYLGGRGELPVVPGLCEIVTEESAAPGGRHAHLAGDVGAMAVLAWGGEPSDPATELGEVNWRLAEEWVPYQRASFVTPAFAAYVSGHSTFSRAAAEVLTGFTGDPYFPGGLAIHRVEPGELHFEDGPTEAVELQWATYRDAADEAGLSRLYGGIHIEADDRKGREMGAEIGLRAWDRAQIIYGS